MNWIPGLRKPLNDYAGLTGKYRVVFALCLALCAAFGTMTAVSQETDKPLRYDIKYLVSVNPATGMVDVELKLSQSRDLLRELTMQPDFARLSNFDGDGDVEIDDRQLRWRPPASGGSLRWRVHVEHLRNDSGYDAWLGPAWGLFRAEDIIPRATTRTLRKASSVTQLAFVLPANWTVVTQYYGQGGRFAIKNSERRYDEPSGWIVMGLIGIRRDTIAGIRVAVAAPTGNSVRRLDVMAMLNWTLPELVRLLPDLPGRLTIVSAGDPMWRGGLSAPQSLFVHADRPLISENATSTLLHEVMHVALGITAAPGYDWIVEGLAEHYSLELLRRSGTISVARHEQARTQQATWAKDAPKLCARSSSGATTALAVTILDKLDKELRSITNGQANLDSLVRELVKVEKPVDLTILTGIATELAVEKPDTLRIESLPGCRNIASNLTQP